MPSQPKDEQNSDRILPESDRAAEFVELYSAHYQRVQFFLMSLTPTADDANEVLQETSVVLWKKFDTFETGTDFFAWACKIARFQTLRHRHQKHRASRIIDDEVVELIADEASQYERSFTGTRAALSDCLESLAESDRHMILERYQPKASVASMASERGWTPNRLSKSLAKLRRVLLECVQRKIAIEKRE